MTTNDDPTTLCDQVFERLVDGRDVAGERGLAHHLGSCMICFRALTELRDAPRIAIALRAETPAVPAAGDRFWDQLAARTTAAAAAALEGVAVFPARPSAAPAPISARAVRRPWFNRAAVATFGMAFAAAAGWMVMMHRPIPTPASPTPKAAAALAMTGAGSTRLSARAPGDEAGADEADVADLDAGALRRLLDRMRGGAPAVLAAEASEGGDAADVPADEEGRVNDEIADLDGDELRRVATSLEAGATW